MKYRENIFKSIHLILITALAAAVVFLFSYASAEIIRLTAKSDELKSDASEKEFISAVFSEKKYKFGKVCSLENDLLYCNLISDCSFKESDDIASYSSAESEEKKAELPEEKNYVEFSVICTAYCSCVECSGIYGNNTSTGVLATAKRTIAVDPSVIPYGTKVEIDGSVYVAEDCGGAIKGNKIDIYFDTHEETESFGVQEKIVKVYMK